ncbi:MAG: thrombospondin type 3 repeat-containing protein, partial [Planctomycetota bacterium]|nr:thrombospondin type 3 repeat-containing protein [Planctomycetota bacterium]
RDRHRHTPNSLLREAFEIVRAGGDAGEMESFASRVVTCTFASLALIRECRSALTAFGSEMELPGRGQDELRGVLSEGEYSPLLLLSFRWVSELAIEKGVELNARQGTALWRRYCLWNESWLVGHVEKPQLAGLDLLRSGCGVFALSGREDFSGLLKQAMELARPGFKSLEQLGALFGTITEEKSAGRFRLLRAGRWYLLCTYSERGYLCFSSFSSSAVSELRLSALEDGFVLTVKSRRRPSELFEKLEGKWICRLHGNSELLLDTDGDGLSDAFESLFGTSVTDADSDDDGQLDSQDFAPLIPGEKSLWPLKAFCLVEYGGDFPLPGQLSRPEPFRLDYPLQLCRPYSQGFYDSQNAVRCTSFPCHASR